MKRNSPSETPDAAPSGGWTADFGFDDSDESWLGHLRRAVRPRELGSVGPYELIEEISRGAQGIVYRARERATGRDIALKRLIGGAFASPETRRRFEREIEATCLLNHAGIVTVYGMQTHGETPFLAMEWVDGVPITAWARHAEHDQRARLRMFLSICDAVQHAHSNGVLHRDLKPSNILVDSGGRPLVVDFGLAKLLDAAGGEAEPTLTTGFVGTPAYASPEQLERGTAQVDVRSDVYSLGVLLYELLTGERPYCADSGLRELLAAQDREDFAPPSALRSECNREIDAICARALAVDPERRYQTVSALADDVRRYVGGEAVQAHPPSSWYQLRKAVRRNPLAAALVAVLFLATAAFGTFALRQARFLERETERAVRAGAAEAVARQRAEDAEHGVRRAFGFLLSELVVRADPRLGERDLTVAEAIERVDEGAREEFADRPLFEVEVRDALARAYFGLQRYGDAARQLERALALRSEHVSGDDGRGELAELRGRLGQALLHAGELERAGALLEEAERGLRASPDADPGRLATTLDCIARWHRDSGRAEESERASREAIRLLSERGGDEHVEELQTLKANLGLTLLHQGRLEEARAVYVECRAVLETIPSTRAEVRLAGVLSNLAVILHETGDHDAAAATAQREVEICARVYGEDHMRVAIGAMNLALALFHLGRFDEAEEAVRRTLAIHTEESGAGPSSAHLLLGRILRELGRHDEALGEIEHAVERRTRRLGPEAHDVREAQVERAHVLVDAGRCEEARAGLEELAGGLDDDSDLLERVRELRDRCSPR